jgi:hypothetical protein
MVLGVAYKKMSISLIWYLADWYSNSLILARKVLFELFPKRIKTTIKQMVYITDDHEFLSLELRNRGLMPFIQIRASAQLKMPYP